MIMAISAGLTGTIRVTVVVISGFRQGSIIHRKMAQALLYTSIPKFFNRVPIGRIVNRMTGDLRVLD